MTVSHDTQLTGIAESAVYPNILKLAHHVGNLPTGSAYAVGAAQVRSARGHARAYSNLRKRSEDRADGGQVHHGDAVPVGEALDADATWPVELPHKRLRLTYCNIVAATAFRKRRWLLIAPTRLMVTE